MNQRLAACRCRILGSGLFLTEVCCSCGMCVHMMNTSNIDEAAAFEILKPLEKNPALS